MLFQIGILQVISMQMMYCKNKSDYIFLHSAVADPGFPVGGRGPRRGAWTPEAVTF